MNLNLIVIFKKLLKDSDAYSIKFWGKIYARDSDYFVMMGTLKNYSNTDASPLAEMKGKKPRTLVMLQVIG